ncbi:MAG: BON domain-containing protein [Desulfobacterales bacterium]|uniref:BON domain-containing protein n=1 Tax=Candidatus Desulfaltia bathyphila TaxID=2841697 RepID=A0A8J6T873_9BACT|nr:BON domain-containing protein [Candidatus Desulfaltia bathyphila]MBL7194953.1 BON domain-containing protein [Desulfobacterales bacterium]MBL7207476.1 BON domain-containing protein [Desulfobacterales bacterium]
MKNYFAAILCLVLLVMSSGCTTFYSAAVDERNVRTVAGDTKIKATILQKFIEDDVVKTFDIDIACYYGHVYLIGEYDAEKQKNRAIKIARKVERVEGITTYLLKKKDGDPCGATDNLAIKAKIKAKLIKDGDIWSTNVDVTVVQCNVVFVGLVGSDKEIEKIIAHAKSVGGIRSVKSFLKVAPHHNQ